MLRGKFPFINKKKTPKPDKENKESPADIYSLVAPGTIRPLSDYHVAINLHKSKHKSGTIKISIKGGAYENTQIVEINPQSTKFINFKIPDIRSESYEVTVEGQNELKFKNSGYINFADHRYFVIFQTDKSTYKPGDLVRYRVIVLDHYLKPVKVNTEINLWIEDGQENRVHQVRNVQLENNIYSNEIQLSESPVLGFWTIKLKIKESEYMKGFEVAEYVLPKFEVSIDAPKFVLCKNEKFQVTVKAKYTFGKPVQGNAVIEIESTGARKSMPIDGNACFEFDIEKDLNFLQDVDQKLHISAQVEESPSGEIQQVSTDVNLRSKEFTLNKINVPYCFLPGVPFDIKIKIDKYDGCALTYLRPFYIFYETHDKPGEKFNIKEYTLDVNGNLYATLKIDGEAKSYAIKAQYLDNYFTIGFVYSKKDENEGGVPDIDMVDASDEEPFLNAHITNENNYRVDDEILVKISSNKRIENVFYQIAARGDLILSDCIQISDSSELIKIKITDLMVPDAFLLAYTIYEDTFLFAELTIKPIEELPSNIKIDAPNTSKPGENVTLSVKSNPNSFIGLLGVDKSVTILKNDNDISVQRIISDLRNYNSISPSGWRSPGNKTGMLVLTNLEMPDEIDFVCCAGPLRYRSGGAKNSHLKRKVKKSKVAAMFSEMGRQEFDTDGLEIPVRKEFPEVWLWNDIKNTENNGKIEIHTKVPDTITTWLVSGFTLDPVTGLNLTKQPTELQVFQDFFVSAELPYSVKQGEIFELPATVFNYTENDLKTEISLDNAKKQFEFLTKNDQRTPKKDTVQRKDLAVSPDHPGTVSFLIRSKTVGSITINLTAKTPNSGDAIERLLLVEPEGVTKFFNNAILVDLREQNSFENKILIDIPKDVVPDSTHVYVTAIGDLLGPIFSNLDELVRLPCGCGEQNMVNFVPNILVLKYLKAIGLQMENLEIQAKKYLEIGYQRELTYKHPEGSYSLFGPSGNYYKPSTWLTAYVVKSFRQASDLTHIDEGVIKSGLDFITKLQTEKGSFPEFGITESLPADDDPKGLTVTAFSLLTLLENSKVYPEFEDRIKKGLDYIAQQVTEFDNINFLAICAYALQLGNHKDKHLVMKILDDKSIVKSGSRWWRPKTKSAWSPREVETTSYALLAFLEDETTPLEYIAQILKWMLSQRNDKGGFHSSQDTVIGLQAVTKAAQKLYSSDTEMSISFLNGKNQSKAVHVNQDNSLVLQTEELPVTTNEVTVRAKGHGTALVQVSYKYNVNMKVTEPKFVIIPEVSLNPEIRNIKLTFATHFIPDADGPSSSSMAIMEVTLPSGYTFNSHSKKTLLASKRVQKVELKKLDTLVIIYFNSLDSAETSVSFDALRSHNVDEQKPVPVVVYDYYNKSYQARAFYSLPESK